MGARSGHRLLHYELTQSVIGAFYAVYNELGYGFLEKVYENAMIHELRKRGYHVQQQALIEVQYDGQVVGQYFADLLIEGKVIVENKAADSIHESHEA